VIETTDTSPVSPEITVNETAIKVEAYYNSGGRRYREDQHLPVDGEMEIHQLDFEYAKDGFRTRVEYPEAFDLQSNSLGRYTIDYTPDDLGRLKTVQGPHRDYLQNLNGATQTTLATFEWAGNKMWSRLYGNGTELRGFDEPVGAGDPTPLFDKAGRRIGARTIDPDGGTGSVACGGTTQCLLDYRYGYDAVGNKTYQQKKHEPLGEPPGSDFNSKVFTHDLMGRLLGMIERDLPTDPTQADLQSTPVTVLDNEDWVLDKLGNWDTHSYLVGGGTVTDDYAAANSLNQYPSVKIAGGDDELFTHDWLGQTRTDEASNQRYIWDAFGRLVRIENLATPPSVIARYRYDAGNRRVLKEDFSTGAMGADQETLFIYDGWRAVEERAVLATGTIVRARYGFGVGLDEVLWMDRDVARDATGPNPEAGTTNNIIEARYFLHHDELGSVVALTDDPASGFGNVVERFGYSSYGAPIAWLNPNWSSGYGAGQGRSWHGLPYLYTGQRWDGGDIKRYYYKSRHFDPKSGRFLSRDRIGYADGPSLYQYAYSSPDSFVDPLGLANISAQLAEARNWIRNSMYLFGTGGSRPKNGCGIGLGAEHQNCTAFKEQSRRWKPSQEADTHIKITWPPWVASFGASSGPRNAKPIDSGVEEQVTVVGGSVDLVRNTQPSAEEIEAEAQDRLEDLWSYYEFGPSDLLSGVGGANTGRLKEQAKALQWMVDNNHAVRNKGGNLSKAAQELSRNTRNTVKSAKSLVRGAWLLAAGFFVADVLEDVGNGESYGRAIGRASVETAPTLLLGAGGAALGGGLCGAAAAPTILGTPVAMAGCGAVGATAGGVVGNQIGTWTAAQIFD
jgi:RHS repeat-associated protein